MLTQLSHCASILCFTQHTHTRISHMRAHTHTHKHTHTQAHTHTHTQSHIPPLLICFSSHFRPLPPGSLLTPFIHNIVSVTLLFASLICTQTQHHRHGQS